MSHDMNTPEEKESVEVEQPAKRSSWEQALDRHIEKANESLSKLPTPNSIDNVNEWAEFIEERIQRSHEHLRKEFKSDLAEWQKAMRIQAFWQWVTTAAVITAFVIQKYLM